MAVHTGMYHQLPHSEQPYPRWSVGRPELAIVRATNIAKAFFLHIYRMSSTPYYSMLHYLRETTLKPNQVSLTG